MPSFLSIQEFTVVAFLFYFIKTLFVSSYKNLLTVSHFVHARLTIFVVRTKSWLTAFCFIFCFWLFLFFWLVIKCAFWYMRTLNFYFTPSPTSFGRFAWIYSIGCRRNFCKTHRKAAFQVLLFPVVKRGNLSAGHLPQKKPLLITISEGMLVFFAQLLFLHVFSVSRLAMIFFFFSPFIPKFIPLHFYYTSSFYFFQTNLLFSFFLI